MSNEITAYKIYSAGVILRGVKCLKGADKDSLVQLLFDISAQVATEREQSVNELQRVTNQLDDARIQLQQRDAHITRIKVAEREQEQAVDKY
jgi:hypothetical protein